MKRESKLFQSYLENVLGTKVEIDETGWESVTCALQKVDPRKNFVKLCLVPGTTRSLLDLVERLQGK